jgi:hypothetical protein
MIAIAAPQFREKSRTLTPSMMVVLARVQHGNRCGRHQSILRAYAGRKFRQEYVCLNNRADQPLASSGKVRLTMINDLLII